MSLVLIDEECFFLEGLDHHRQQTRLQHPVLRNYFSSFFDISSVNGPSSWLGRLLVCSVVSVILTLGKKSHLTCCSDWSLTNGTSGTPRLLVYCLGRRSPSTCSGLLGAVWLEQWPRQSATRLWPFVQSDWFKIGSRSLRGHAQHYSSKQHYFSRTVPLFFTMHLFFTISFHSLPHLHLSHQYSLVGR
ncbi:hypothetical protein B0H63DRAFT_34192 [Podospora didyma]|uniref:Uncharacterized protein n=1 Tax=Podospora didyma TaxID=330526 RepID=A0AAE0P673_9PEZI|nr:hypothetical protein B0H63DRAFT_34192 [Podospora didyma]